MENKNKTINSHIEFGLRALIIITQLGEKGTDIDRLLIYDYMLTNSGDFNSKFPSIHAETPYKYSKLLVKRDVLKEGLNTFCNYGLLDISLTKEGIRYKKNKFTSGFLNNIDSEYKDNLVEIAKWISKEIHVLDIKKIEEDIQSKIKKYGVEFYTE